MLKISDATIEIIADGIVDLIRQGRLLKDNAEGGNGWQGKENLETLWYSYIKRVDPHEKEYIVIISKLLQRQANEVFDKIKRYPNSYKKWMFDKKKWLREFAGAEAKFIVKLYKQEGQKAIDLALKLSRKSYYKAEEIPITFAFDVYNPKVTSELVKQTRRFPAGVVGTSEEIIRREIANGLELGESIDKLRKRVTRRLGPDYIKNRSEMIARSETIYASNAGAELGYMQSGVVEGKKWLTALDERTCDPCTDMNNMTAPLGQPTWEKEGLDIGGVQGKYGLDFDYTEGEMPHPPLHPRCRCTITPIVKAVTKKPPLENLRISNANLEQLRGEMKLNGMLFDQTNKLESASATKVRIDIELTKKLQSNRNFMKYIELQIPPKPTDPIYLKEWYAIRERKARDVLFDWIRGWAGTSGDANAHAIAMQMAAQAEFGLTGTTLKHLPISEALEIFKKQGKAMQAFLRAQYNLTQEFFKKNGITHLTGYRGTAFVKRVPGFQFGDDFVTASGKLQLQPMSSFSTDITEARGFVYKSTREYKMMAQSNVPVNRILSTCQTGFGCKSEAEFVLLGGQDIFKVTTIRGRFDATANDVLKLFADFKVAPRMPSLSVLRERWIKEEADTRAALRHLYNEDQKAFVKYHKLAKKQEIANDTLPYGHPTRERLYKEVPKAYKEYKTVHDSVNLKIDLLRDKIGESLYANKTGFTVNKVLYDPHVSAEARKKVEPIIKKFTKFLDEKVWKDKLDVIISEVKDIRVFSSGRGIFINTKAGFIKLDTQIFHEMGHAIEFGNPEIKEKLVAFYNKRTKGEVAQWLGPSFDKGEFAKIDKFIDKYMGKVYPGGETELLSMGLQCLLQRPAEFAAKDPEMFDLIIGILRGL